MAKYSPSGSALVDIKSKEYRPRNGDGNSVKLYGPAIEPLGLITAAMILLTPLAKSLAS